MATVRRDKEAMYDENHFLGLIKKMHDYGVDCFRINLAKFKMDEIPLIERDVNGVYELLGNQIKFVLDVAYPGEKIRLCMSEKNLRIGVREGDFIELYSKGCSRFAEKNEVEVSCDAIGDKVQIGERIYYGDGTVCFTVDSIVNKDHIRIIAMNSGKVEHSKAFNVSNSLVCNFDNLKLAMELQQNIHSKCMAFSFIESPEQLKVINETLRGSGVKVMSKIETQRGVENIKDILPYTHEVMLGRGDLGLFSDLNKFSLSQEQVIEACKTAGKKVWIATDVLSSMESRNVPFRSEIIDVYNIKKAGANGVVLTYGLVRSPRIKKAIEIIQGQQTEI